MMSDDSNHTTHTNQTDNLGMWDAVEQLRTTRFYAVLPPALLGAFGNILIILVMKDITTAASILIIYMATSDSLALLFKFLLLLPPLNHYKYRSIVNLLWSTFVYSSVSAGSWILVLICAERFISVVYPHRRSTLVTFKRVHTTVVLLCSFILFYHTFFAFISEKYGEIFKEYHKLYLSEYENLVTLFVVAFLLPVVSIFVLTSSVIIKLKRPEKSQSIEFGKRNQRQSLETTLSRLMISSAVMFFVLITPMSVYITLYKTNLSSGQRNICFIIFSVFIDLTHALNFFVYVIFSKRFRKGSLKVCKQIFQYLNVLRPGFTNRFVL